MVRLMVVNVVGVAIFYFRQHSFRTLHHDSQPFLARKGTGTKKMDILKISLENRQVSPGWLSEFLENPKFQENLNGVFQEKLRSSIPERKI